MPRAPRRAGYGAAKQRRAVELLARIALVDVDRAILRVAAVMWAPT